MHKNNRRNEMSLLDGLGENMIKMLFEEGQIKNYKNHEVVFRAREMAEYVYILVSGKIILYNLTHSGKRKIIFILGKGALLNDKIVSGGKMATYCETIEPCEILRIPIIKFKGIMEQHFELTKEVMSYQEIKVCRLSHQLKNTTGGIYMEKKLAAKLWKLARDFGIPKEDGIEIDINMSITMLADLLGAPRENTSRLFKTLTDYGLIRMEKKRILVIDPDRLLKFYKTGNLD